MDEIGNEVYQSDGYGEPLDIILITHGRLQDLTVPCVAAIYAHTHNLFHLIVVDDSTPDMDGEKEYSTPDYFKRLQIEYGNITFVHSDTPYKTGNQIFNVGLSKGNARFVATIMNSVRVEPDWDIVPLQMMANNPKIGITGMKCLKSGWNDREDGQIESAGIWLSGYTPCDMGRDLPGHRLSHTYPCWSVQWAFALLRREAVVGNLDENIWEGFVGFDDIDNTLVLRYKGWESWYCGLGVGYHQTHATRGSNEDSALLKNKRNGEVFYKRWGLWDIYKQQNPYAPEHYPNGEVKFLVNANDLPLAVKNE